VLAHDIAKGIIVLVDADRLRSAKMLGRSLFEYHLRLRIYQVAPAEALRDATDAPKELRRFLESEPVSEVSKLDISPEAIAEFEAFIENNKGKPRPRNVWHDLKAVNVEDHAQALFEYLNLYGFPSAFIHGSGLIFKDVIQAKNDTATVLAWKSPYLTRLLILVELFVRLVGVLEAIEQTSGYFQAHVVLNRKYHEIMRPLAQRFARTF
jgi:hypothetical protein